MVWSKRTLASVAVLCAVFGLTLLAPAWLQAAKVTSRDLVRLSPDEFAELPEVKAMIDPERLDRDLMAAAIFHETNRWRRRLGLPAFKHRMKLDEAADVQATFGSLMPTVGHVNSLPAQASPMARVLAVGYTPGLVAENVALTPVLDAAEETSFAMEGEGEAKKFFDPKSGRELRPHSYASFAARVLVQWMNSPGHRANIANRDLRYLGCSARSTRNISGIRSLFSVQEFFTPESPYFR